MSDFHFDRLKNIKTPETWIEDALNIPQKNKKAVPIFLRPAVISSAAALVIVSAVLIILFFHMNNGLRVNPQPNQIPVTAVPATEKDTESETSASGAAEIVPDSTAASIAPANSLPQPTERMTEPRETSQPAAHSTSPVEGTVSPGTTAPPSGATEPTRGNIPLTEPAEATVPLTEPPVPVTQPQTVHPYYEGTLEFEISRRNSRYFSDFDNLLIEISDDQHSFLCAPYAESGGASRTVYFCPYDSGIYLEKHHQYIVSLVDVESLEGEGDDTFSFVLGDNENVKIFYLD